MTLHVLFRAILGDLPHQSAAQFRFKKRIGDEGWCRSAVESRLRADFEIACWTCLLINLLGLVFQYAFRVAFIAFPRGLIRTNQTLSSRR